MLRIKNAIKKIYEFSEKRILPLALLLAVLIVSIVVLGNSVKTVNISDGEKTITVRTLKNDISSVLSGLNLKSNKYKVLSQSKNKNVLAVSIGYTFPVYITCGEITKKVDVIAGTVEEILGFAGIKVDSYDMVYPSLDTVIEKTAYIDYTDIDYVEGSYLETIPCTVKKVYSPKYAKGDEKTVAKGKNGIKQVNYTSKLINGEEVYKSVTGAVTIEKAVACKKIIGTATKGSKKMTAVTTSGSVKTISRLTPKNEIALDINGAPVNYSKKIVVEATAYTYTGHNCSTGVSPKPGYIAVNPKVIPYGTKLYIKSADGKYTYGYAIAADTGGFIKSRPNNVDLFMATRSACNQFGRRNVEIYFIK